jgi:hypothetical protein
MRKLPTLALSLVALAALSGLGVAQQETKGAQQEPIVTRQRPTDIPGASPEITSTRIAANQIARVQADPAFKAALAFLEEQGEAANLISGQVLSSRSQPGITEYSFDVTMRGSGEAGEYAKLVYSEQTGKPAFVYFDGNCTVGRKAVAPQPSELARGTFCFFKPWGPWQVTNTFCSYNFWCFFKNQQALYLSEKRQRTCPNGTVQTQARTVKVHCGC